MSSPEWVIPSPSDDLDHSSMFPLAGNIPSRVPSPALYAEEAPSPPASLPSTRSPSPELDDLYNLQSVVFQAERRVFQVLKQGFMAPGTKFESVLADPTNLKGKNLKNPILLDVTVKDFRAFLRVLYPFWNFGSYEEESLDISDWTGVLRIAKDWKFTRIREKAVTELTLLLAGKFRDMIRLGQELRVEDWLRQGLIGLAGEICKTDMKPVEVINGQSVFIKDEWIHVANLFYLCQKAYKANTQRRAVCCGNWTGPDYGSETCGSCGKYWNNVNIAQLVDEVFSAELATTRGDPPPATIEPQIDIEAQIVNEPSSSEPASVKKGKKKKGAIIRK